MESNSAPEKKVHENAFFRALDFTEAAICLIGMSAITLIIFIHVIFRYVVQSPLQWSEEVARMMTIWIAFGGASYGFRRGAHIGVTALIDKAQGKMKTFIRFSGQILVILFFILTFYFGLQLTIGMVGVSSVAAKIPMVLPFLSIPVGSAMVLIRLIQQLVVEFFIKGNKEGEAK